MAALEEALRQAQRLTELLEDEVTRQRAEREELERRDDAGGSR